MSVIADNSPSIMSGLKTTPFRANEEIFTIIDHNRNTALIYDFERRRVNSRCIVRFVDCKNRTMTEIRSRTLRFTIKSTFAPLPDADEGITFTGGGFTASVITKDNIYRVISAMPDFPLDDKKRGIKTNIEFSIDTSSASFNQIYTKNRCTEAIHSSISPSVTGSVIIGGEKKTLNEEDFSARRVWKTTSFPLRRNSYSSYCYGRRDGIPFSFTLSVEDRKCFLLDGNSLTASENIRMERNEDDDYIFTNGEDTEIKFSPFSTVKEKTGPFRLNRTIRYGIFSGRISSFIIPESFGLIEF